VATRGSRFGWPDALQVRKIDFSQDIFRGLNANDLADAKCKCIAGIDADPFLNNQFPNASYYLSNDYFVNGNCFVVVNFRSPDGKRDWSKVLPELALVNGRWVFVNFYYNKIWSKGDDLLSYLHADGFLRGSESPIRRSSTNTPRDVKHDAPRGLV